MMEKNNYCIDRERASLANLPANDIYGVFKLWPTTVFPIGHKRLLIFDQSKCESKDQSTYVSNVHEEEMHEDTEEIDALLYSDSENEYNEEEEPSTGHSPMEKITDAPVTLPSKRRRVEYENDDNALEDTASSTNCCSSMNASRKKAKGEKIQETVAVLRGIVPGGGGKNAASVLDEAIKYLKYLRLKAKGMGISTGEEKEDGTMIETWNG